MDYEDKHAVYMYRCIVYDRVKDFKSVLNDLNKTISINPNHPVLIANYVRGKINIDLKRWGDEEMISRSLSIKALQKNLLLLTLIGYANLMLQNNSEALEDLNKSIRKGTNFGDANGFRVMIKSKNIEYYGVDDICRKHLGSVALFLERDTGVSYILSFVTK